MGNGFLKMVVLGSFRGGLVGSLLNRWVVGMVEGCFSGLWVVVDFF